MNRNEIKDCFNAITPTKEQKRRILNNIMDKKQPVVVFNYYKYLYAAAVILIIACLGFFYKLSIYDIHNVDESPNLVAKVGDVENKDNGEITHFLPELSEDTAPGNKENINTGSKSTEDYSDVLPDKTDSDVSDAEEGKNGTSTESDKDKVRVDNNKNEVENIKLPGIQNNNNENVLSDDRNTSSSDETNIPQDTKPSGGRPSVNEALGESDSSSDMTDVDSAISQKPSTNFPQITPVPPMSSGGGSFFGSGGGGGGSSGGSPSLGDGVVHYNNQSLMSSQYAGYVPQRLPSGYSLSSAVGYSKSLELIYKSSSGAITLKIIQNSGGASVDTLKSLTDSSGRMNTTISMGLYTANIDFPASVASQIYDMLVSCACYN